MTNQQLLERIKNLNVQTIENMSYDVMAKLTNGFDEQLVKNMLYTATTNRDQRKIIRKIKNSYRSWKKETDMFWGAMPQFEKYPDFLEMLMMDIECDMIITPSGVEPTPEELPFKAPPALGLALRRRQNSDEEKKIKESDAGSNQSEFSGNSYIESLNKQLAELKNENEILKERIKVLENQLKPEEQLTEDQKMGIDERIVLVSIALGVTLSKDDTNQTQLAQAIAHFSGDYWKSIRSRIVNINKELLQESKTPGDGFSQGTLEAVNNVKEWLKKIGKTGIAPATKKLIEEIDDIYLNKKE